MKKLLIALVLVTLLVGDLTPVLAPTPAAEAQIIPSPVANLFVGIIRIVGAFNRRNRVYNEARLTVEDLSAYYDNLIDHMSPAEMGRQYWRTRWQIEQERQAVIQAAEYVKRGARNQFGNEMGQTFLDQLAGAKGAVKFVGRIRETVKVAQAAAIQIQAVAATAQEVPELMVETLNEQLGWFGLSENEVKQLGGGLGQILNDALGGIPDRVEAGSAQLEADMETTINTLTEMDSFLDSVLQGGRSPISAPTMAGGNIRGSGAGTEATVNQTIDNFLGLFVALDAAGKPPPFMTNIRDNMRIQLLAGHLQTLDAAAYGASFADCEIVDRAGYLAAAGQLGMTPEIALDEERVIYKICRHRDSGEIFYAFMIGPNAPREETDPVEEGEAGGDELYGAAFDGFWAGPAVCTESESMRSRWSVGLIQSADGTIAGTVHFHACQNGGGQVAYHVTGSVPAAGQTSVTLTGTKTGGVGKLDENTPAVVVFTITKGQPPVPELSGRGG